MDGNVYKTFLKQRREENANRRATQVTTEQSDPMSTAQNLQISEELGVDQNAVTINPDLYKHALEQRRAETALQDAPKLNSWLNDPANRALAKPELEQLSLWERASDPLGLIMDGTTQLGTVAADAIGNTGFGRGVRSGAVGAERMAASLGALPNQGQMAANLRILGAFNEIGDQQGPIDLAGLGIDNPMSVEASFVQGYMQATPEERDAMIMEFTAQLTEQEEFNTWYRDLMQQYSDRIQGIQGDTTVDWSSVDTLEGFGEFVAFSIGQALPFMAISALSGAVAGVPGVVGTGLGIGAGDITSDALQDMDPGEPLDTAQVYAGAIPYAAVELLGPVGSRVRGIFGREVGAVADGFLRQFARQVPADMAEEYANEFLQEMFKDTFQARTLGEDPSFEMEDFIRWHNAGMAGMAAGAAFGAVGSVVDRVQAQPPEGGIPIQTGTATRAMMEDMAKAMSAGRTAMSLERVDQMVSQTQMAELAPAKFKEYLTALGLEDQQIFLPADGVRELFQGMDGEDVTAVLGEWGIDPGQYEAAILTGGDVSISMATYASEISGTDQAQWVQENGTLDANEMSMAEARVFAERSPQDTVIDQTMSDEDRQRATERADSAASLYEDIYRQSLQAGASDAVSDVRARVTTAMRTGLMDAFGEQAWMEGNYDRLFDIELRQRTAPEQPAQNEIRQPGEPATIETLPEGWQDVEIEVQLEDGEAAVAKAGEVLEYQNQRIKDVMAVLRCIDG